MTEYTTVIGLFISVLAILAAFAKWFIYWAEKRDAEQEAHFNKRLEDHKREFETVHSRIDKHVDELTETREQLHKDYVKQSEVLAWRAEIREDFKGVYQKLGGIDRAVNQLVGIIEGKFKNG